MSDVRDRTGARGEGGVQLRRRNVSAEDDRDPSALKGLPDEARFPPLPFVARNGGGMG